MTFVPEIQKDAEEYVEESRRREIIRLYESGLKCDAIAKQFAPMTEADVFMILATTGNPKTRAQMLPPSAAPANEGLRYDAGKPRFDLIPPEAMLALAQHYAIGAQKYADRNWEKGMNWGRCFRSAMSHLWQWLRGEEFDEETGSHHMICAAWNCFALYVYWVRKIGKDDRGVPGQPFAGLELWKEPKLSPSPPQ